MTRFAMLAWVFGVVGCSETPRWEWPVSAPEEQGMDSTRLDGARACSDSLRPILAAVQ